MRERSALLDSTRSKLPSFHFPAPCVILNPESVTQRGVRMRKRLLSVLLAVLMLCSLAPGALAADVGPDTALHSKGDIARYMARIDYQTDEEDTFAAAPDCRVPPYSAGKISDKTRADALAILNTIRYIAGLPAVTSDAGYEAYAQAAALVNAVNDGISHYPEKPAQISDELYRQGYYGAYNANLSYGRKNLYQAVVFGWMGDNSSQANLDTVGHRRWALSPAMAKTGFGIVPLEDPDGYRYTVSAMYVTDFGRTNAPETVVAWPARYTPYQFFSPYAPWSVSVDAQLNPDAVSVTLQRESDGRTWRFSNAGSDGHFSINTDEIGGMPCIIFMPDEGMEAMEDGSCVPGDRYTVTVTGALPRTIRYTVEFFDPAEAMDDPAAPVTPTPTPAKPEVKNPFTDVKTGAFYYDPVLWAVNHDPQITNGTSPTMFSPEATCTRGQVVTFLWRAMNCPEPKSTKNPFTDVKPGDYFYKAVLWAAENGITTGTSKTAFSPNQPCTRAHVVTFLWRAHQMPAAGKTNPFKDVAAGQYYTDAVLWAVSKNITNGIDATHFGPNNPCTRGQIVTFLHRDLGK